MNLFVFFLLRRRCCLTLRRLVPESCLLPLLLDGGENIILIANSPNRHLLQLVIHMHRMYSWIDEYFLNKINKSIYRNLIVKRGRKEQKHSWLRVSSNNLKNLKTGSLLSFWKKDKDQTKEAFESSRINTSKMRQCLLDLLLAAKRVEGHLHLHKLSLHTLAPCWHNLQVSHAFSVCMQMQTLRLTLTSLMSEPC